MPILFNMAKARPLLAFLILSLAVASCKKEIHATQPAPFISAQTTTIDSLRLFLHTSMGIALEEIVFDSPRQLFVINHTGLVTLENAKHNFALAGNNAGARGINANRLVPYDTIKDVRIYITPDAALIPGAWGLAIEQAVFAWNNTDCPIHITIITDPTQANLFIYPFTTVVPTTSPSYLKEVAQGEFGAFNGALGRSVHINLAYTSIISQSAKLTAVAHALSHCFGFVNNNDGTGLSLIPEIELHTPEDPNSAFETLNHEWTGFNFFDYVTIGRAYPRPTSNWTTVHLLRYYSTGFTDHSYVTDITVYGAGTTDYAFEKGDGYLKKTNENDTTLHPVYRFEQPLAHDNMLTTDFFEINGNLGYQYRGIIGYITLRKFPGQRPLYRYWSNAQQDHLYTTDLNELGLFNASYNLEKSIGYVW